MVNAIGSGPMDPCSTRGGTAISFQCPDRSTDRIFGYEPNDVGSNPALDAKFYCLISSVVERLPRKQQTSVRFQHWAPRFTKHVNVLYYNKD